MEPNFTSNDLVQMVYREPKGSKKIEIANWMDTNWSAKEQYLSMKEAQRSLPKLELSPSDACIDSILSYSNRNRMEVVH